MPRARVAEVFAALSLTTDLATGVPFEKGLRTCALATAFGAELALDDADLAAVFHVALLRSIGCTAHASENAALFGDDTAFAAAFSRLDPGDPVVFAGQLADFGRWVPGRQTQLARTFVAIAPVEGPRASRAGCEVSRALGVRLGLSPVAIGPGVPAGTWTPISPPPSCVRPTPCSPPSTRPISWRPSSRRSRRPLPRWARHRSTTCV